MEIAYTLGMAAKVIRGGGVATNVRLYTSSRSMVKLE